MIGTPITVPAISIRHLSQRTRNWLHRATAPSDHTDPIELPCMIAPHDNGFFMTLPSEETCQAEYLPADLVTLAKAYAVEEHWPPFGWILLDVDGDVVPELPTYD